jgi:hypothetical protein
MMNSIATDGNYIYAAGETAAGTEERPLISKYDAVSGNLIWEKVYDFGAQARFQGISYYKGYLFAGGYKFEGEDYNGYYAKIDLDGDIVWSDVYGYRTEFTSSPIIINDYVLFFGSGWNLAGKESGEDWFLFLTDLSGKKIADWNFSSIGNNEDRIMGAYYDQKEFLYLAGYGNNMISSGSMQDFLVKKLSINSGN